MPDINLSTDYLDHPKTRLLVAQHGEWAEIVPIRMMLYVGRFHAETGIVTGHHVQLLEASLKWRKKGSTGIQALVDVGFLEKINEDTYVAHDFAERNRHIAGISAARSAASKVRWDKYRAAKKASTDANASVCNANALQVQSNRNASYERTNELTHQEGGGREILNPGYPAHAAHLKEASRLVRLFVERTRTNFRATTAPAERALAQAFLDGPVDLAAIERGIDAYAAECERTGAKACGPGPFFEKAMWASYSDERLPPTTSGAKRNADLAQRLKEQATPKGGQA